MNPDMQGDFQICISVPFKDNYFLEHLRAAASVTLPPTLVEVFFFFSDTILQRHAHLKLVY